MTHNVLEWKGQTLNLLHLQKKNKNKNKTLQKKSSVEQIHLKVLNIYDT